MELGYWPDTSSDGKDVSGLKSRISKIRENLTMQPVCRDTIDSYDKVLRMWVRSVQM